MEIVMGSGMALVGVILLFFVKRKQRPGNGVKIRLVARAKKIVGT